MYFIIKHSYKMQAKKTIEGHIAADYDRCTEGLAKTYELCVTKPVEPQPPQPWYWSWWPAPKTCADAYSSGMNLCMETMMSRQERLLRAQAPFTQITQTNNNDASRSQVRQIK